MKTWICAKCGEERQQAWIPTNWVTAEFWSNQYPDGNGDEKIIREMLLCEGCYMAIIQPCKTMESSK